MTGDTNAKDDIFVRNTVAGTTVRVSLGAAGAQSDNLSDNPAIAGDGNTTAFHSDATNLVPNDTNNTTDVFVRGPAYDAATYGYDRLSRLTTVAGPGGARTYAYDPAGNRSSRVLSGTTTIYGYDRADRISAAGSTSLTSDTNGNTLTKGSDSYTYDQPNRLRSATVAGQTETYSYDGDGVRFSRTVGGNPAIRYVSDVNTSLPLTLDDGIRKYVYGLGLAYAVGGSSLEIYHTDRLGSVRAITDASGAVIATYRTDAFGLPTATTGSSSQPFGFTGEPLDTTGLVYLRARYYDPSLGRFLGRDILPGAMTDSTSLNRYGYASDNPVTSTDHNGLCRDPGGSGLRYCIDRYIQASQFCIAFVACGNGDGRGPSASGGSFKSQTLIYQSPTGRWVVSTDAGFSKLDVGPLHFGPSQGSSSCQLSKSKALGILFLATSCRAVNGLNGTAGQIKTDITIAQAGGDTGVWAASGTLYPNAEVWVYGGSNGPQLLLDYRAAGAEPIGGLSANGNLITGQQALSPIFWGPLPIP